MNRITLTITLLVSAFLFSCLPIIGRQADSAVSLRIMSYNVRHGTSINGDENIEGQAAIIKAQRPDLAALQEIDIKCNRSGSVDQAQRFAGLTGMKPNFGAFMPYDGGEYGLVSLSRTKPDSVEILRLPAGAEPRTAVIQFLSFAGRSRIAFVNVHFDWTKSDLRLPQVKTLLNRLDNLKMAAIIAGDYNAVPGSPSIKLFEQAGFTAISKIPQPFTFNAKNPSKEIDYIYVRSSDNVELRLDRLEVLDEPDASDHRPVLGIISVKIK